MSSEDLSGSADSCVQAVLSYVEQRRVCVALDERSAIATVRTAIEQQYGVEVLFLLD